MTTFTILPAVKMRLTTKYLLQSTLNQYGRGEKDEDMQRMYTCDVSNLSPELAATFVQFQMDSETEAFLERSRKQSANICLQIFYTFVSILLSLFLTTTAINGLLERGRMFVFSHDHLTRLLICTSSQPLPHSTSTSSQPLPHSTCTSSQPLPHSVVLDIGSGDGHVTDKIRKVLRVPTVHVTETCRIMAKVLRKKGYRVEDPNSWHTGGCKYDFISCLNVLDRCSHPLSMLKQISDSLLPGGKLLLALVLPYEPFVENALYQGRPSEKLPLTSRDTWEESASILWREVLHPLGYTPLAISRLPYLCEGDLHEEYYALDDVILLLEKT